LPPQLKTLNCPRNILQPEISPNLTSSLSYRHLQCLAQRSRTNTHAHRLTTLRCPITSLHWTATFTSQEKAACDVTHRLVRDTDDGSITAGSWEQGSCRLPVEVNERLENALEEMSHPQSHDHANLARPPLTTFGVRETTYVPRTR
jgi:hypothetical protein